MSQQPHFVSETERLYRAWMSGDADNGFRPAGLFHLSSTTVTGAQVFNDYGTNPTDNVTATHHLTLYRAKSGALVFGFDASSS